MKLMQKELLEEVLENDMKTKINKWIGEKFGRLTINKQVGSNKSGALFECSCTCGGIKIANIGNIKRKDYVPTCGNCWENLPEDLSLN